MLGREALRLLQQLPLLLPPDKSTVLDGRRIRSAAVEKLNTKKRSNDENQRFRCISLTHAKAD